MRSQARSDTPRSVLEVSRKLTVEIHQDRWHIQRVISPSLTIPSLWTRHPYWDEPPGCQHRRMAAKGDIDLIIRHSITPQ